MDQVKRGIKCFQDALKVYVYQPDDGGQVADIAESWVPLGRMRRVNEIRLRRSYLPTLFIATVVRPLPLPEYGRHPTETKSWLQRQVTDLVSKMLMWLTGSETPQVHPQKTLDIFKNSTSWPCSWSSTHSTDSSWSVTQGMLSFTSGVA